MAQIRCRGAMTPPPTRREERHGIKRPCYQKQMYEQSLSWFDEHVKGAAPATD